LPDDISNRIFKLVRSYKLRFAAIDLALDSKGEWVFFEINPNGQWAWLDIFADAEIASDFAKAILNRNDF
jgi:D-alanine-D-alanine ligase-like ATP-grasp enzyme